jgi:hypothetical protein
MINVDLFEEELEDTKGVTRIRKSKNDRQTQWTKEKGQRDKQHSTKHIHKTKDRVTENTNLLVVNDCRFTEILFLCRLSPF